MPLPTITNPTPIVVAAQSAVTFPAFFLTSLTVKAPTPTAKWPIGATLTPYDPVSGNVATPAQAPPVNLSRPDVSADAETYPAVGQVMGAILQVVGPYKLATDLATQWAGAITQSKAATAALATANAALAAATAATTDPDQANMIATANTEIAAQQAIVTSTAGTIANASAAWLTAAAALGQTTLTQPPEVTAALGS